MKLTERALRAALWLASWAIYHNGIHADWAYEKMQRPRTWLTLAANLANYFSRRPRVHRMFGVVVEPVFGCNLRCQGCWGAYALAGRRPTHMPWRLFEEVVDQTPSYVETITFSLMGEPLMHPRLHEMIAFAADRGFRTIVFTNGTLLTGDALIRIAQSPLAVLNVSVEPDAESSHEFRGVDLAAVRRNVDAFLAAKRSETQVKLSLVAHSGNYERLGRVWEQWAGVVRHVKISPRMGTNFEAGGPGPLCMEPWRGNLNVFTNGDVSPCCFDYFAELAIGNLYRQTLEEIVQGEAYRDLMAGLLAGQAPQRCVQCTEWKAEGVPLRAPKRPARRPSKAS